LGHFLKKEAVICHPFLKFGASLVASNLPEYPLLANPTPVAISPEGRLTVAAPGLKAGMKVP
jgi:hypothetical protein